MAPKALRSLCLVTVLGRATGDRRGALHFAVGARVAQGESVIKYKSPLNVLNAKTHTIIAAIEHVEMKSGT